MTRSEVSTLTVGNLVKRTGGDATDYYRVTNFTETACKTTVYVDLTMYASSDQARWHNSALQTCTLLVALLLGFEWSLVTSSSEQPPDLLAIKL